MTPALALLLLLGALLLACGKTESGTPQGEGARESEQKRPPFVLITIDTLRADHVGAYGYFRETTPNIDRFAEDALLFERVVAPMSTTLPSHVSIMTATYPLRHGVVSNFRFFLEPLKTTDDLQTAAQMLRRAGYQTAAFTSSSPLCEESGINAGFELFLGPPPYDGAETRIDISAEETIERAIEWLGVAKLPFFLWVHLFDPHDPYRPPPPFDHAYSNETGLFAFLERYQFPQDRRKRAARMANRYDGEILYADTHVGRLLAGLKELGLYERAIIVLTGDHGEGLMQHSFPHHGVVWNEQLLVPLIIRFPGGPRGRRSSLASLIDILPTVAAEGALPLETEQFDGINLVREKRESALSQRTLLKTRKTPTWTLTNDRWKFWYRLENPDRLYDLEEDPHETSNVIDRYPAVADAMREEIHRLLASNEGTRPLRVKEEVSEEIREQLRTLGYVE